MKFDNNNVKEQEKRRNNTTYQNYTKEYSIPLARIYRDKSIIQRNMPKRKIRKLKPRKGIL